MCDFFESLRSTSTLIWKQKFLVFCTIFYLLFSLDTVAQTNTWDGDAADGNWNSPTNWSLDVVPTVAHDVVIPNGITNTITVNTAAVCSSLTINEGGTDNIVSISSGNSLTVSNEVTIGAGTGNGDEKTLAVNDGTLTCSSVSLASVGGFGRFSRITATTGTINVTGDIVMGATGFFSTTGIQFTNAGVLNIGGTMTGGSFTASTSTVDYNNVNQIIGGYTYNNLILSGSGSKDISDVTTINGDLTLNGTVSTTALNSMTIGGDFILSSNTTFTAGVNTHSIGGDWVNNGGTFNHTGSIINLNGAGQTIGGTNATTFDLLSLSGSGTKTFNFATTISSNFSIDNGVVADLGTFTGHTANGLTLAGASQVAGIWGHSNGTGVTQSNDTYFANNTGVITTASAGANIYYTRQTGNWNATTTWSTITYGDATNNGSFPVAGDLVYVGGGDFTITVNVASACKAIYYQGDVANSPTISISGAVTFTVSDNINIPRTPFLSGDTNTLAVGGGTLNAGSINFSGGGVLGGNALTIGTGTATVSGDIVADGNYLLAAITFTDAGLLQVGGDFINSGNGAFTASTGTVEFNGSSAQVIGDFTYNNLIVSGSGEKTVAGVIDINGDFTLASGTTFTAGSYTHTLAGDWINNGGTFNHAGSNINMDGAGQSIGGSNATTFNRLSLSGSGTKTFVFATTIAGNFSIDGTAVADLGTFTGHTAAGLSLGGTSQVAGIWGHTNGTGVTHPNNTYFANNTGVITTASAGANIYFTRQTGNWNAAATWSTITYGDVTNNGTFPVAGDIVNIGGGDFTITVNVSSACQDLYFQSDAAFSPIVSIGGSNTLDVSNDIFIPYTANFSGDVNTFAVGAGTLNTSNINFSSSQLGGSPTLTISTGTANIDGDMTSTGDGEATFTFTSAGLLQLGGAIVGASNIDMTAGTGTVEYDGTAAQTIVDLDYYNLTLNNSVVAIPAFTLNGNTTVTNTLTMTEGIVDMNEFIFTLGTSSAASTLSRSASTTTNWFYNGTFSRIWQTAIAVTSNSGNYYGLLPIGSSTASSYRPVEISSTVSPTGAGTFSVSHTDADTKTVLSPVYDDGGTNIEGKHDAPFNLSTSASGGTYNINITMTDLAPGTLSDIRLAKSTGGTTVVTVGTHAAATGSATNPTAGRTGVSLAELVGDWRMATIDVMDTPLPVELSAFTGHWKESGVLLQWSTASELNNDYFELEHSVDGSIFNKIATIDGHGTTNELSEYTFDDSGYVQGINYYRLKQVDFDGKPEIFDPIAISTSSLQQAELTIYPNPTKDKLNIRLDGFNSQNESSLTIVDHLGKVVYHEILPPATQLKTLDNLGTVLVPGIYIINVQSGTENLRRKLAIQL
ncbi:MAG: T9SS type A sorting domain-containing protein [Reichenbachiella sp.]|uniref:T9SS type A sorting domain-containing protein n=1 Tax=Reichenbachiella sp. TaxID=2184521 RepID=UPI0032987B63